MTASTAQPDSAVTTQQIQSALEATNLNGEATPMSPPRPPGGFWGDDENFVPSHTANSTIYQSHPVSIPFSPLPIPSSIPNIKQGNKRPAAE